MKYLTILLTLVALFACMVAAGWNDPTKVDNMLDKARKQHKTKTVCLKGKKKNGKCIRSTLRVRSADSDEFFEIPDVEDAHWADEHLESDDTEEEI